MTVDSLGGSLGGIPCVGRFFNRCLSLHGSGSGRTLVMRDVHGNIRFGKAGL